LHESSSSFTQHLPALSPDCRKSDEVGVGPETDTAGYELAVAMIHDWRAPPQLCAIALTSHKPATPNRLTKTRAMAFTTMRCRYSSSLSRHSYFERSGTGE